MQATPELAGIVADAFAVGIGLPDAAVSVDWTLGNSHCFAEDPEPPTRCGNATLQHLPPQLNWCILPPAWTGQLSLLR